MINPCINHFGETLCWYCSKACGDCSWSDGTFTPIPGWDADYIQRDEIDDGTYDYTYRIKDCPEFEKGFVNLYKEIGDDIQAFKGTAKISKHIVNTNFM